MSKKGLGVYDLKQGTFVKGKWSKKNAKTMDTRKFTHAYAEDVNSKFGFNGRFLVLNEKLDKAYQKAVNEKQKEKTDLSAMKVDELRPMARELGVENYGKLKKPELILAISNALEK